VQTLWDRDERYWVWARRLRETGLAPAVIIALEMIKPASVLCGQMLEMASVLGGPSLSALGKLCEEPDGVAALQALIMDEGASQEEELGDG